MIYVNRWAACVTQPRRCLSSWCARFFCSCRRKVGHFLDARRLGAGTGTQSRRRGLRHQVVLGSSPILKREYQRRPSTPMREITLSDIAWVLEGALDRAVPHVVDGSGSLGGGPRFGKWQSLARNAAFCCVRKRCQARRSGRTYRCERGRARSDCYSPCRAFRSEKHFVRVLEAARHDRI